MCGIGGFVDYQRDVREMQAVGVRMAQTLTPRGPDAGGQYVDETVMLVHRRLIVVDPSGGQQPMASPDGNIILVYNGELYNTEDLRKPLLEKGHRFRGHSDTEVLLHAYLEWGTAAFEKLNGIYAFALWDRREKRLILCRDRLGVKPLFYSRRKHGLVFGSEIKCVLAHPEVEPVVGEDGLRSLLLLGPARVPGQGVFEQVEELLPAHWAELTADGWRVQPYWTLRAQPHTDSPAQTLEKTRALIEDAAARQLVSDVPLCTFLSGGLDSSILSMLAAREYRKHNRQLHTWSVDYKDNDKYFTKSLFQPNSDSAYIKMMSDAIGSEHHAVVLEQRQLCNALDAAADARDLPGMADVDSSLLLFCAAVREQFTVSQSGECADELFGGYPWYHREEILFEEGFPWSRSTGFRLSLLQDGVVRDGEEFVRQQYRDTCAAADKLPEDSVKDARMREMFLLNLRWFMATLLDRKDRMSMACGLEVRVPFCDHRIVEYAYNMPWEIKSWGGREKGVVREAFRDALPPEIVNRKKSPYPKTFSPEYTVLVRERVRRLAADPDSIVCRLFRPEKLAQLVDNSEEMPEPWFGQLMRGPQVLAYLIQLDRWSRNFGVQLK